MKFAEAKTKLEEMGIEVVESTTSKNGKEVKCLIVGNGRVKPTIYEKMIEEIETDAELLEFTAQAIESIPAIEVEKITSKEYVLENCYTCIRHASPDNMTLKFEVYGDLEEYIRVKVNEEASFAVTEAHVKSLGIVPLELREAARRNSRKTASIKSMSQVLTEQMGLELEELPFGDTDDLMYVASTNNGHNGASIMLFHDLLRKFCIEHNTTSCTIIPSSIHEVILLLNVDNTNEVDNMVQEVNETQVEETDQLSNHTYEFHI